MNSGPLSLRIYSGRSIRSDRCLEQPEQVGRLDAAVGMDAVTLAGVLVNQVAQP